MYAYVIDRPEGSFNLVDTPRPVPGNDQVLVRVRATGINPLDAQIRAGRADHAQQPLPAVLGIDMAGTVEDGRVDKVVVDHKSKGSKDPVLKAGPIEPIPADEICRQPPLANSIRSVCSRM